MSAPPFTPNEALPEDAGVVSIFPSQERTFREVMESWMLYEHGTSGHHEFLADTTVNIDGDTTWPVGSVAYDTTLAKFKIVTSIGPIVWKLIGPEFPTGGTVKMLFLMTTPPTGWTKITDAAYQDAAIRCTTGTIGPTGGTAAFETALAARTILQANLPSVNLDLSETVVTDATLTEPSQGTASGSGGGPVCILSTQLFTKTETAVTAALGGSGTAMDFDVKFVDAVAATKA